MKKVNILNKEEINIFVFFILYAQISSSNLKHQCPTMEWEHVAKPCPHKEALKSGNEGH